MSSFRVHLLRIQHPEVNLISRTSFLATLEYFEGTLFPTTNRNETFDRVFRALIHISITYSELTSASRLLVWKNFADRIPKAGHDIKQHDSESFTEYNLHGRQIMNAMKSAGLLSQSVKPARPLRAEDVMKVSRIRRLQRWGEIRDRDREERIRSIS